MRFKPSTGKMGQKPKSKKSRDGGLPEMLRA